MVAPTSWRFTGPGAYAVDRKKEWFRNRTGGVAVAASLVFASAIVTLVMRN